MAKQNVVHPCNSTTPALKRKEILTHATTRMNFENIALSDPISRAPVSPHLQEVPRRARSTEAGSRWVHQGLGLGKRQLVLHRCKIFLELSYIM